MSFRLLPMERFAYSVRELVDHLAPEGDEEEKLRLLRQVRHWTNADLLTPLGEKNTGTGVSRKYGPDEVRKAAILRELSRFGLTVTKLEGMGDYLDYLAEGSEWRDAITDKRAIYLEMLWEPGDGTHAWRIAKADDLLDMLRPDWKPPHRRKKRAGGPPDPQFTSALVLSLNRIFAGVNV